MKLSVRMLIVLVFALSVATVALARGTPTKQKAFTSNAAVEVVSPIVTTAPVMIGYDVIENISTQTRDQLIAHNTLNVDTSARSRLSSTRAWRSNASNASRFAVNHQTPCIVLLA